MVKPIEIDSRSPNHLSELAQPSNNFNQIRESNGKIGEHPGSVFPTSDSKAVQPESIVGAAVEKSIDKKEDEKQKTEELEQAFETVSEFMSLYNRNVNFSLDEGSDKTIIKVFDSDSKELIKQFPSEDLLEMARKIHEVRQDIDLKTGIFLDEKV